MDSAALMLAAGRPFHEMGMLAARDYFFHGPAARRILLRVLNLLPVDRGNGKALAETIALSKSFLARSGGGLIVFPEGSRSRTEGIRPFKRGAAILAEQLGVPVVPAFVDGTGRAMPKGVLLPRPARLTVAFGPPVDLHRLTAHASTPREAQICIAQGLEAQVRQLKEIVDAQ